MEKERKLKYRINNPNPPEEFGFTLAKIFLEVHRPKLEQAILDYKNKEETKNDNITKKDF